MNNVASPARIRKLSSEAAEHGDLDMVAICERALGAVALVRAQREASRLCSEMARETADSPQRAAEFASQGEEIDNGYKTALDEIAEGRLANATATLEGVRSLEKAGGDDQHASRSIDAVEALVECERVLTEASARSSEAQS